MVPEGRKTKGFLGAVLARTGKPRKLTARGKKKRRPVGYVAANGAPAGEESGIGGGPGGGAAGGGS